MMPVWRPDIDYIYLYQHLHHILSSIYYYHPPLPLSTPPSYHIIVLLLLSTSTSINTSVISYHRSTTLIHLYLYQHLHHIISSIYYSHPPLPLPSLLLLLQLMVAYNIVSMSCFKLVIASSSSSSSSKHARRSVSRDR
jgi:hypothetical protein